MQASLNEQSEVSFLWIFMRTKYENVKETVEKLGEAASPNEDRIKFMLEWKCLQYSSWTTKGLDILIA